MAFSCIDDNQIMSHLVKITFNFTNLRIGNISEINRDHTTYCTGQLIQKSGAFQPVFVFSILSGFCVGYYADTSLIKQMIYDNTDKHLKGSRRTYTCTSDNIGCGIRIKPLYFVSALQQSCKNSFQKRLCTGCFFCGLQMIQINNQMLVISLTDQGNFTCSIGSGCCHTVQMYTSCQNFSMVVIGMIAADLCSSRRGEEIKFFIAKCFHKSLRNHLISCGICFGTMFSIHLPKQFHCIFAFDSPRYIC